MFVAVVKTPPSNLWIMAILTPLFLLMVVIGMVAFILCKRNRVIFKTGAFRTFKTRSKVRLSNSVIQLYPFLLLLFTAYVPFHLLFLFLLFAHPKMFKHRCFTLVVWETNSIVKFQQRLHSPVLNEWHIAQKPIVLSCSFRSEKLNIIWAGLTHLFSCCPIALGHC